jgi:hypothetical protein
MTSKACPFNLPIPQQFGDLFWNTVAFSHDESVIGASARSGHAFTWERVNGTWENPDGPNVAQCPLNGDEAYIAFVGEGSTERLCRIAENVALFEIAHKDDGTNQFSRFPRGNLPTLKTFTEWPCNWDLPTSVSWSADNSWIISGDNSGGVQCWDQYGQVQFTLYPHSTGNAAQTIMD